MRADEITQLYDLKAVAEQFGVKLKGSGWGMCPFPSHIHRENSAFGLLPSGDWSVIVPEEVLREWFDGVILDRAKGNQPQTLYGILGITQVALPEEIKTAYRRMARQWHPDVCKEPDADERFKQINHAYEMLSNPNKRARYDAGMTLEASLANTQATYMPVTSYRPNLRCGFILAKGNERVGRFNVTKILAWEDITNSQGQVLVSSWPRGAQKHIETWV